MIFPLFVFQPESSTPDKVKYIYPAQLTLFVFYLVILFLSPHSKASNISQFFLQFRGLKLVGYCSLSIFFFISIIVYDLIPFLMYSNIDNSKIHVWNGQFQNITDSLSLKICQPMGIKFLRDCLSGRWFAFDLNITEQIVVFLIGIGGSYLMQFIIQDVIVTCIFSIFT